MVLHGKDDLLAILWSKNIIEAKKTLNFYKKALHPNIKELEILDVMAILRFNGIANPKMVEEWTNLII